MIRCVSTKPNKQTGEYRVTFLSPAVVNNRHFMKKYGWKVEELKEENLKAVKPSKEAPAETQDMNLVAPEEFADVPEVEFIETQEAKPKARTTKPRAGKAKTTGKTTKQ